MLAINSATDALIDRALAAQVASQTKVRVFYFRGEMWRVKLVNFRARRVVLEEIARPRRSIDDCTPDEWHEASRTAQANPYHRWHDWRGSRSGAPVAPNTRVEFICRDNTRYTMEARFAFWSHGGGDKDIIRYRYA